MNVNFETKAVPSQALEDLDGKEMKAYLEIKSEECFIWAEHIKTVVVGDDVTHITMVGGKVYDVPTTEWMAYMSSK